MDFTPKVLIMKKLLTFFVLFFSSSVVAYEQILICKSKQDFLIQYDKSHKVNEDKTTYFKIKIDTKEGQIYVYEVIDNEKISDEQLLYTDQVWTITSGENNDIRAYGSVLGEIMYSINSQEITFTFPLGGGSVGISIADCT